MSDQYKVFTETKGDQYIVTVTEDGARRAHVFSDKAEAEKFREQQTARLAAILDESSNKD